MDIKRYKYLKYTPILILIVLAVIAWLSGVAELFDLDSLKKNQHMIENYIQQHYEVSMLLYVLLYIAVVAISLPGATLMTLLGGFLFGNVLGTVLVVISATIGATILFVSAKMASADILRKKAGTWVKKMQKGFQANALSYMLTLRLIPLFPFVAINLVAALLQIPLRIFFWGTFVGIIPGSFVYATIGSGLHDLTQNPELSPKVIFGLVALGIIALSPVIYKKLRRL